MIPLVKIAKRLLPLLMILGLMAGACRAQQSGQPSATPGATEAEETPSPDESQSPPAGVEYNFDLTGAAEVPGPGDPDGTGKAQVIIEEVQVCFKLEVSGIGKPDAAHIHEGAEGVAGPIVVTLTTPEGTSEPFKSEGCIPADRALLARMRQFFYINVHNPEFPKGAVRGQFAAGPTRF